MQGTENLFDKAMIANFKKGSWLVNTARGKIANTEAVVEALESGHLRGYAGDVWYPQPAPKDHPWRKMPNHGMTPHYSGTTLDAQVCIPLLLYLCCRALCMLCQARPARQISYAVADYTCHCSSISCQMSLSSQHVPYRLVC